MPEMRFYHLTTSPMDKALPALVSKMVTGGYKVVILSDDEARLKEADQRLWTFSQSYFIPHGTYKDPHPEEQAVYLTHDEENPNSANVLVLLGDLQPKMAANMDICADIFDGADAAQVEAARKRWSACKEAGQFDMTYWKQNDKGGWEKA